MEEETKYLQDKAKEIRVEIIKMLSIAQSGHPAGALGLADLFSCLYFKILNHNPKEPHWEDRDRLFISNGHVAPALYASLALSSYFPTTRLKTLRKFGSILQGHPERLKLSGVESTSGPLGSGLAQAAGCAWASRKLQKRFRVFCIASDGEHDEGNHWEAVLFAAKYKLSNLTMFVDRNHIQIGGKTEEIMPLEPISEKYRAFNWAVILCDGNNAQEILSSVKKARENYDKPTAIVLNTVPGKGVPFMENNYEWHGKPPSELEAKIAIKNIMNSK